MTILWENIVITLIAGILIIAIGIIIIKIIIKSFRK